MDTQVAGRSAESRTAPPLPTWARVVLVALLVVMWLAWFFLAFFVLNFTGVAGDFGGWRWAAVAFVPILIPTWLLTRRLGRPRVSLAVSAVLVGLLVWGVTAGATPSFARVTEFAESLAPEGSQYLGDEWEGNEWCFSDGCPTVVRYYAVTDADAVVKAVTSTLERQGPALCKGDYNVRIERAGNGPTRFDVAKVPVGMEGVRMRVGARCP